MTPYETGEILFYKPENGEMRVEIQVNPKFCVKSIECRIEQNL